MKASAAQGDVTIWRSRTKAIVPYLETHLRLTEGVHRGETIQFKNSPWMIKPLQMWDDDERQKVLILKGTGCGGTYVAEGGAAYKTNVRPVNVGYQIWTKPKAARIGKRLFNKLERMPDYQRRKASKGYSTRKQEAEFTWPPTALYVQEASETAAQTDRLDDVINDEPWLYPQGRCSEFYKRTNGAMPYHKHVGVSSAPRTPEHEYYVDWLEGCQDEFHLCCPKCSQLFIPITGEESKKRYSMHVVQWDDEGSKEHQVSSCRLVCPSCSAEYRDEPRIRRDLLEGSDYIPNNPGAPRRFYSCRWNSWVAWFIPFADLLGEYLTAIEVAGRGDTAKMEDFVIKREARAWQGIALNERKLNITGDYELVESPHPVPATKNTGGTNAIWHAPEWDEEEIDEKGYGLMRFAGIDVQKEILWCWIAQGAVGGKQRLMWCGKLRTWPEVEAILEFFRVPPWQTGCDIGYTRGCEVPITIIQNGWIALRGADDANNDGFVHEWEEGDETGTERLSYTPEPTPWDMSHFSGYESGMPEHIDVYSWSHRRIMDHLWNLRNGDGTYWGLPSNIEILEDDMTWTESEKICKQLDSTRFLRASPRTNANANKKLVPFLWQKRASHLRDDLWDCASMCLTLMHMQRFFDPPEGSEK